MFLAKKRIAIAYEDGFKEGYEEGLEEVRKSARATARAEERAILAPRIAELTSTVERMQEEIRLLREARSSTPSSG